MKFGNYEADGRDLARGRRVSGHQWKFKFTNGFGASIINDGYGGDRGLYELAVLDRNGSITYDTPITDDVLGFLTAEQVGDALAQIESLQAEVPS